MPNIKLYTQDYGPFPHIIRIALAEKGVEPGVDLEVESVDPVTKHEGFLSVSPTGKTPLLVVEGEPLFETAVILEAVDELFHPERSLRPQGVVARARDRSWSLFGLELLMDSFYAITAKDEASSRPHLEETRSKLTRLEPLLAEGPYFGGAEVRLVDFVYAAFFLRMQLFRDEFGWDPLASFPHLRAWSKALLARRTVRDTLPGDFETMTAGFIRSMGGHLTRPDAAE